SPDAVREPRKERRVPPEKPEEPRAAPTQRAVLYRPRGGVQCRLTPLCLPFVGAAPRASCEYHDEAWKPVRPQRIPSLIARARTSATGNLPARRADTT